MARYGAESATFGGVVFKRAKIWGGCFGYWKIQNGPSVFHIDPLHGLIWPRCKGQFSPKFWYQNSPISVGLNWPQRQYHSGLTRFGPIFGTKLALFILQCRSVFWVRGRNTTVWPIKRKLLSSTFFGGTVYYAAQGGSNFWLFGRNSKVWPFKWKLLSSTFLWYCLLCRIQGGSSFWVCEWKKS